MYSPQLYCCSTAAAKKMAETGWQFSSWQEHCESGFVRRSKWIVVEKSRLHLQPCPCVGGSEVKSGGGATV